MSVVINEVFNVMVKSYELILMYVHSCQQKSIGQKFSKSQTGSDVRYSCHHNSSYITFSNEEYALLNKGLKYNLNHKHNKWIKTLALEAETAISYLPHTEQEYLRYRVAHNIKLLYKH